jgi:hypothetical protein
MFLEEECSGAQGAGCLRSGSRRMAQREKGRCP